MPTLPFPLRHLRWLPLACLLAGWTCFPLMQWIAPHTDFKAWEYDESGTSAFLFALLALAWVLLPLHALVFAAIALWKRCARRLNAVVLVLTLAAYAVLLGVALA